MKYLALLPACLALVEAHGKKGGHKGGFVAPVTPIVEPIAIAVAPKPYLRPLATPVKRAPFFAAEYECTPPVESCPFGFSMNGNVCEKELLSSPDMVCHSGELVGSMCLHQAATLPSCVPGFSLQGGVCCKTVSEALIPVCPDGYTDIGDCCEKPIPAPVVEVCPVGSRVGGSCVVTHRSAPIVSKFCAEGYEDTDGECCKIETYDCTPPGAEPLECGDDDNSSMCVSFRRNLGSCGRNPACIEKVRNEIRERVKETAVIQQTCERKIVTPHLSSSFCASGELIGNMCVLEEHHAPVHKCTAEGDVGNCFSSLIADYEHICPSGFERAGGLCTAVMEDAIVPICPSGFDMVGGGCQRTSDASPVCRVGTLGNDHLCHDKDFAPPTVTWCTTCTGSNCVVSSCH